MASSDSAIVAEIPFIGHLHKNGRLELEESSIDFVPPGFDEATGVTSKDVMIDPINDLKARLFLPSGSEGKKLPTLLYFHGGGFIMSSALGAYPTYLLNNMVSRTNVLGVSIDYRLFSVANAYDDAMTSLKWLLAPGADEWITLYGDLDHVFFSGDSAGGNIVHQLAMLLKENHIPEVEGVALLCPYFWGIDPLPNEATGYWVRLAFALAWQLVGVKLDHQWANPLMEGAPSLAGLGCKRAFVCVASEDLLVWRGKAHYEGLKGSGWGGDAEIEEYEGVGHCWFAYDTDSEQTSKLMAKLAEFFHGTLL